MNYCSECTYLDIESGNSGDFLCKYYYDRKLASQICCGNFCKAYSRDNKKIENAYNYSKKSTENNCGCFLTTIICSILKMDDNNEYLNTLRDFRKNILQKNDTCTEYKNILAQYDIIGPEISRLLNTDPLRFQIAQLYFIKYIVPITKLIKINKYNTSIQLYSEMVNTFMNMYGITINIVDDIFKGININESGHGKIKELCTSM